MSSAMAHCSTMLWVGVIVIAALVIHCGASERRARQWWWWTLGWLTTPAPPTQESKTPGGASSTFRPRFAALQESPVDDAPAGASQAAIDFSDIMLPADHRRATRAAAAQAEQVDSVNERFEKARRRNDEHKLRPGIVPNAERRKLVQSLLRRSGCSRRVRSWRTENSDTLRGDVVPKNASTWGMMRAGRTNPDIDLHAGSLGPLSGLDGRWNSTELLPDNLVEDDA